jgi:Matrixin
VGSTADEAGVDARSARRAISRRGLGIGASSLVCAFAGAVIVTGAIPRSPGASRVAVPVPLTSLVPAAPRTSNTAPPTTALTRVRPVTSTTTIAPPETGSAPAAPALHVPAAAPSASTGTLAVAAAVSTKDYAFEVRNADGSPARWDPCTPVHYVVNLTAAPPTAAADIAGAITRVEAATGMTFVADGPTTEVPARSRTNEDPARYGHRWAPLLIAWVHNGASDYLGGSGVLGEGGASWVAPSAGRDVFVTGQIAVNADTTAALPDGFGAGTTIGLLLLHELGHVMGLAHVGDEAQLMFPRLMPRAAAAYAAGDLAGLRLLTSGGCDRAPAAA